MKQLTGLDASFLYMETGHHVRTRQRPGLYERPDDDFDPYDEVYARWGSLVGQLEPMRRRLVEVPFSPRPPVLGDGPELRPGVPHPPPEPGAAGRADQLAEQVARIVGRPMDRSRPLWEVYVIEGLESGRWALLTKYHHATIDGASGVMMLKLMHDTSPDATPPGENRPWEPEAIPAEAELLRLTFENFLRNPAKAARTQLRLVRESPRPPASRASAPGPAAPARRSGRWSPLATARGSTFRCQQRRRRRGTARSPPTAGSPCGRRRSTTSSG